MDVIYDSIHLVIVITTLMVERLVVVVVRDISVLGLRSTDYNIRLDVIIGDGLGDETMVVSVDAPVTVYVNFVLDDDVYD